MTGPQLQQAFDNEAAGITVRRIRIAHRHDTPPAIDIIAELAAFAAASLIPLALAALWVVLP